MDWPIDRSSSVIEKKIQF